MFIVIVFIPTEIMRQIILEMTEFSCRNFNFNFCDSKSKSISSAAAFHPAAAAIDGDGF